VTGLGTYNIHAVDPVGGQAAFLAVLQEGTKLTMFVVRLKQTGQRIVEVETVVARVIPKEFESAVAQLSTVRPAFSQSVLQQDKSPRATLIAAANSYYEGVERSSGDIVAFSNDCHRIENGVALVNNSSFSFGFVSPSGRPLPNFAAMGCREQFNTGIWGTDSVTNRRYEVVDENKGIVVAFTQYNSFAKSRCATVKGYGLACPAKVLEPFALDLVEFFKIRAGKIHEIESVWTVLPPGTKTGWAAQPALPPSP
jgi:hypothetical protein